MKLLRWELFKLFRRRASYVTPALTGVFCLAIIFGFAFSNFRGLKKYAGMLPIDPLQYINGYYFTNFCLNIAFFSLLPLFATVVAGSQIAGEAHDGTLRLLMVRPLSRSRVFAVKALVSFLWLQFQVILLVVFSLMVGSIALGGGDFLVFIWEFRYAGPWVVDGANVPLILLATTLCAGLSLFMISAAALAASTFTENPSVAHIGTLGAFFISSVIHSLPDPVMSVKFKAMMPTKHMTFWHELYRLWHPDPSVFDSQRFWTDVAWLAGYTVLFLAIGFVRFTRKDITS